MSEEDKNGLLGKFKTTLSHTRTKLGKGIAGLVLSQKGISDEFLEDVETQMLTSDVGIEATTEIIENLRKKNNRNFFGWRWRLALCGEVPCHTTPLLKALASSVPGRFPLGDRPVSGEIYR